MLFSVSFWEHPGGARKHPGTTEDQFGGSWSIQGPCCVEVNFQEILIKIATQMQIWYKQASDTNPCSTGEHASILHTNHDK